MSLYKFWDTLNCTLRWRSKYVLEFRRRSILVVYKILFLCDLVREIKSIQKCSSYRWDSTTSELEPKQLCQDVIICHSLQRNERRHTSVCIFLTCHHKNFMFQFSVHHQIKSLCFALAPCWYFLFYQRIYPCFPKLSSYKTSWSCNEWH